jgi:uncharacterized protein YndB with AHSA1/START domain
MLINILVAAALIIVVFVIVVALRPPMFRVTRSIIIAAPPEAVFPYVHELKRWEAWNPWGKLDPNMKLTYEGPASGVGAAYAWAGNNQVGEGRMAITESRPNELIRFNLQFFKPMAGVSTAEFTFEPQGNRTEATWTMFGKNNFIARVFGLFINCDKMIGGQFEKGLAELKAIAEGAGK